MVKEFRWIYGCSPRENLLLDTWVPNIEAFFWTTWSSWGYKMDYCMEYSLGWTSINPSSLAVKCGNMRKPSMGFDPSSAGGESPLGVQCLDKEESWIEIDETIEFQAPCMVNLPTFGWFSGQMLVNIPYMEHLGWDFKLQNQSKSIHLSSSTNRRRNVVSFMT